MLVCPRCGSEYVDGFVTCSDCGVALLAPGAEPPMRTSHLGRFAAPVGARVLELVRAKGIAYDFERHDDEFAIRIDEAWRDDVAVQLYTGWSEFLAGFDREDVAHLVTTGDAHPGWLDAPTEVWADRHGRLQVAVEEQGDSGRALGPALVVAGLALVLLGVVDAIDPALGITFGLVLGALGALLPR